MEKRHFMLVIGMTAIFLLGSLLMPQAGMAVFVPTNGQAARLVLGQPDFTSTGTATTQTGMNWPVGVAVDPTTGKVFVADSRNNRILRFASVTPDVNSGHETFSCCNLPCIKLPLIDSRG